MRRTQLYLEDDLWAVLHAQAKAANTSLSELVRQAVRDRYLGSAAERKRAMLEVVGIWKDRKEFEDVETYIRGLRRGTRLTPLENS
jgi:predicted CopG family antitoxin